MHTDLFHLFVLFIYLFLLLANEFRYPGFAVCGGHTIIPFHILMYVGL